NYYYFDAKPGIAYDLYTTSTLDTQGTLYDADKNRLGYDDNSGLENNFAFVQSYDGRRYLKVGTKGTATGSYTLSLRKRFAVPVLTGKEGQDSYIVSWNAIDKAKEYLVTIYDAGGRIGDAIVTETSYEYVYTNETAGKTLAFTVTPRENAELTGEESRRIYNTNRDSKWHYDTPMLQSRINFASTVCGGKIYVLGGEDKDTSAVFRDLEVFEPEKQTWTKVSEYPGNAAGTRDAGIVNARMVTVGGKLYVFGGQTDTSTLARTIKEAYCYDPDSARWTRLADLSEGRTEMPVTVLDGKIYIFAKAGSTERVDVYDPKEDTWSSDVKADTSTNLQARTVDGRIFVLREKEAENKELPAKMYWEEYLPETGEYDNAGEICSFANADQYLSGAVVNGKIYMVNNRETSQVICYDVYLDQWSQLSVFNLKKSCSKLQSVGTTLYSLGGFMQGFGTLDVVEAYELETVQITKQLEVVKGEDYELQVDAGNCEEDTDYLVTVRIDPSVLSFSRTSSFMQRKKFEQGRDGIQLVHYAPKKGVIVVKLRGKMETGDTIQAYQSIPAAGLKNETTVVSMEIQNGKKQ
ncbi:MAG: hypothetical protein J1F02_12390, partial [Lachnospiraceae bacterium]|nr:hypothetical protein [Lachnospiraceae bacterium]